MELSLGKEATRNQFILQVSIFSQKTYKFLSRDRIWVIFKEFIDPIPKEKSKVENSETKW